LVLTSFYIVFMLGFYTQIRWRRYGNVGTWKFTFKTKTKPTLKNMNKKLHNIQDEVEHRYLRKESKDSQGTTISISTMNTTQDLSPPESSSHISSTPTERRMSRITHRRHSVDSTIFFNKNDSLSKGIDNHRSSMVSNLSDSIRRESQSRDSLQIEKPKMKLERSPSKVRFELDNSAHENKTLRAASPMPAKGRDGLRLSQLNASELHKRRMSKNQNAKIPEPKIPLPSKNLQNSQEDDVTDGNAATRNRRSLDQSTIPGKLTSDSPVHTIPATDDIKQILLGLDQQKMMIILNKLNESEDFRPSMKIEGADDDIEYV